MFGRRKTRAAANQQYAGGPATTTTGVDGTNYDTGVPAGAAAGGGMGSDNYVQQPQYVNQNGSAAPLGNNNDDDVGMQKTGYGNGGYTDHNNQTSGQIPPSYDAAYVGPDGVPIDNNLERKKKNSAANKCAACFVACWACTWPCHGPCCCGL